MSGMNSPLKLVMPWKKFWNGTWKRRNIYNGNWFILEIFLFGAIFIAIPYFLSNNIASIYLEDTFKMFPENRYDRSIPVINWMIIPYTALYLFYPIYSHSSYFLQIIIFSIKFIQIILYF